MAYLLVLRRYEHLLQYNSVKRWQRGLKEGSGRKTGLYHLARYIDFLKSISVKKDPDQLVEECIDGNYRTLSDHLDMVKRFVEGDTLESLSRNARDRIYASIRSFYLHNRVSLPREPLRFNSSNNVSHKEQDSIVLDQIKKAVSHKECSVRDRAIVLCLFQSGMDDSTLADIFNFIAYPQLVKHFGTEQHSAWSLERCPVKIDLVRPKTGYRYYTFIDKDAVEALKDWLNLRQSRTGDKVQILPSDKPNDLAKSDPIFIVRDGKPVRAYLVSKLFRDVGVAAGIIVKPSAKVERYRGATRRYAFHSHEVRDVLKSLARISGVDGPVADFFLGHSIDRLGYDKSPWKFPEFFREQYMKMSKFLNVLSAPVYEQGAASSDVTRRLSDLEAKNRIMEKNLTETTVTALSLLQVAGTLVPDEREPEFHRLLEEKMAELRRQFSAANRVKKGSETSQ